MYLRFETDICFKGTSCKKGIFAALGDLKRKNIMNLDDYILYRRNVEWFNENIGFPSCYLHPIIGDVKFKSISWFKFVLGPHIDRANSLVKLLEKYEVQVNVLTAENLQHVIYEDSLQVVVKLPAKSLRDAG